MEKTSTEINKPKISRKRHIAKTITWRIVGSIDTWIIGYVLIRFFSEGHQGVQGMNMRAVEAASYIAGLELIKLFYIIPTKEYGTD